MKVEKLSNMKNGWLIGNFSPSILETNQFEVVVRSYKAGFMEKKHFHKLATEIIVIVTGRVLIKGVEYKDGDVIVNEPFDECDFQTITDTITTVVKVPSISDDKYYCE